ncbi:hypothetical protein RIF29_40046 [Crotalaria pallida]|uniref:Uncharacterized protein n=1 Tax=Crotalaria pallida TaxID=3830 RepID=A0AAN9E353_CROPI
MCWDSGKCTRSYKDFLPSLFSFGVRQFVAQNMRELYRLVLVGSALSPWNSNYCGFQEEPLWTFAHMDLSTDIIFVSEFESNDGYLASPLLHLV